MYISDLIELNNLFNNLFVTACFAYHNSTTNDLLCIGIDSWAYSEDLNKDEPWPNVGVKLSAYYDWIHSQGVSKNNIYILFCANCDYNLCEVIVILIFINQF